jgi:signal peptide peptidase SppA
LAIAISINSPGGSPVQSHLIYSYIRKQAVKKKKKVLVFAEDVAASGGYLIACAGDEIYAKSSSIVGSIGVIYSSFGLQDLIKKAGIQRRIYTAGKNKSTLDPFVEEKEEDIQRLKKIQLDLHSDFIKVVEESRSTKLKKDKNPDLFTGEFWSGSKAKDLGLIDGLGNADEILKEKFERLFGFSNFLITTFSPNFSFKISSALPKPSIKPKSFALEPDQNSPVNRSGFLSFLSLVDLLSSTTFIKSECKSNCIFFNL